MASSSEAYARRFDGPIGEVLLAAQTSSLLAQLAGLPPPARVLDVGGGHGQLVLPLLAAGHRPTVLASGPGLHRLVRRRTVEASCLSGSLTDPPLAGESFDVVVCFRILAHTTDWRGLVAALCRLARQAVVLEFPARSSVNAFAQPFFRLKRRIEGDTRPFSTLRVSQVAAACREAGFPDIRIERQLLLPLVLHRWAGSAALSRRLEELGRRLGLTPRLGSPVVLRARRHPRWTIPGGLSRSDDLLSGPVEDLFHGRARRSGGVARAMT